MKKDLLAVVLFIALYAGVNILFLLVTEHGGATIASWMWFVQQRPQLVQLLAFFIVQEILLLGLFALVFRQRKGEGGLHAIISFFRERSQRKWWMLAIKRSVGGLIAYIFLSGILLWILEYTGVTIPGMYGEQMVMTVLQSIALEGWIDYLLLFLLAVIVGPIVEELLFRGFLTDTLAKHRGWWGVLLAAIIFAVAHLEWGVVINLTILALFLSYIYRKTWSMRYSLLFHMGINGLAVVALILSQHYPGLVG